MTLYLITLSKRRAPKGHLGHAVEDYIQRVSRYIAVKDVRLADEQAFLNWRARQQAKDPCWIVLLDSGGQMLSSADFAREWERWRDTGKRQMALVVGPADGWSEEARKSADFLLSLGSMTLPHELAAVVAAEQVYRVLTILAGHPYHSGH